MDSAARLIALRSAVALPHLAYPLELPVCARREEIAAAIAEHQVVIVAGATGSGKTTQLPKILLELGRGRAGQIGHTQPRRIAARTVAERIAQELDTEVGDIIGYQVRFTDETSDATLVKVMTDGILLAQIQRDPMLWAYDSLIIDEAHERSLNIDFILGYLTRLLPQRPDLKVVITSATIDSQLFAKHFSGPDAVPAPVIEVTGRTYPVEIRYRPLEPDGETGPAAEAADQATGICQAARQLMAAGPGDILVFCSGEREIRDASEALAEEFGATVVGKETKPTKGKSAIGKSKGHPRPGQAGVTGRLEVLPLYARLSAAEQHRVFEPHDARRIVLATNVAETSLTVPGIRYVIDPGTARISRYSKATKVQRLPIEPVSQASANQRAGRCGRVADGICIRLYSEADFDSRPAFTEPEILRTSLASVILQMIAVGVVKSPGDIVAFPFVQPPEARNVRDGVALLTELGALDTAAAGGKTALTSLGRQLAQIPIDPRLGRMIVEAGRHGVVREVTIIAAALAIQDPRERPVDLQTAADQAHRRFADPTSDFLSLLNLWEYLRGRRREQSSSAFRRLARAEFLNFLRLREWQDLVAQLRQIIRPLGLVPEHHPQRAQPLRVKATIDPRATTTADADSTVDQAAGPPTRFGWRADAVHKALLPGLLSQLGMRLDSTTEASVKTSKTDRRQAKGTTAARQRNEYVGARNARLAIFPGSPLFAKPPSWIMAAELVETSRLWARSVASINPEWAEVAGAHLVKRTYSNPRWSQGRGGALIDEKVLLYGLPIVTARPVPLTRVDPEQARDLFIEHALVRGEWRTHHEFYIHNRDLLEQAEDLAERTRGRPIDLQDVFDFYDERLPPNATSVRAFDAWWKKARQRHPDLLTLTPQRFGLDDPTAAREGYPDHWLTGDFRLPITYEYAPGSAADGVTVHIPVTIANQIWPDGFDWQIPGLRTELVTALIKSLPKKERVHLVPAADTARSIAPQLANPKAWRNQAGRILPLTQALSAIFRDARDVVIPAEAWTYERVPEHLQMRFVIENPRGQPMAEGTDFLAVREQAAPGIRQTIAALAQASPKTTKAAAGQAQAQPLDLRGLLLAELQLPPGRITSRLRTDQALPLAASNYANSDALIIDCQAAALDALISQNGQLPANQADYIKLRDQLRDKLEDLTGQIVKQISQILTQAQALRQRISEVTALPVLNSITEIKSHIETLLGDGFISAAGQTQLQHFRRYLKADAYRLDRLGATRAREEQGIWLLAQLDEAYESAVATIRPYQIQPPELRNVRWMLEELRVSLFAQQLGTAYPISEKRIRKALMSVLACGD